MLSRHLQLMLKIERGSTATSVFESTYLSMDISDQLYPGIYLRELIIAIILVIMFFLHKIDSNQLFFTH